MVARISSCPNLAIAERLFPPASLPQDGKIPFKSITLHELDSRTTNGTTLRRANGYDGGRPGYGGQYDVTDSVLSGA